MAPRRLKVGQGFSLFDLKDVISDVTDTLGDALTKQGVDVSKDNLFLQLQNLVQNVGTSNGYSDSYGGVLSASDKVPYSIAGDMMVIAYEHFKNGEEKLATKNILAAMGSEDFEAIANGILLMNKKGDLTIQADESSENEETEDSDDDLTDDDDTDDTDADSDDADTDEDADDEDLEDSDIDDAVSDNETTASDEDEDEDEVQKEDSDKPVTDKTDNEDEPKKPEVEKKPTPMGKTSSELTASHTSKVLANKLSLDGSALNRAKAKDFLRKNQNL